MEKNKYKFIYFVILLIIIIISIWIFFWFLKKVDKNNYVELLSWRASINWNFLKQNSKVKIFENDNLKTFENSLAILEWWDWSITRLWWNTEIMVKKAYFSKNDEIIKIAFDTKSWKTWSNVVSYFWDESYFHQYYNDTEIAVRWTIYALDIEKNYLKVEKHWVKLENKNQKIELKENEQIKLTDFSLIFLDDFINYFKDKKFFEINQDLDKKYFYELYLKLEKNIKKISDLSYKKFWNITEEQKEKLFKKYLEIYQKIHFVSPDISEKYFNLKINLKEKLLKLSPENQKKYILQSFNYDFIDIFNYKNFINFEKILNIFKENEKYVQKDLLYNFLKNLNSNFNPKEHFSSSIDTFISSVKNNPLYADFFNKFWEEINNSFKNTIENQKSIFAEIYDWFKNLINN